MNANLPLEPLEPRNHNNRGIGKKSQFAELKIFIGVTYRDPMRTEIEDV